MPTHDSDLDECQRRVKVLARQTDCLIRKLNLGALDAGRSSLGTPEFCQAADAYERLHAACRKTTQVTWERTLVDGRNGDELMDRLWNVREALRVWR